MKYLSQIMTSASGSMNGVTASRNRGGQYFRRRAVPVNPNTSAQQSARAALSTLTTAWGTELTESQRQGWNEYAQVVPVTNTLGESIKLSGQQMFIRGNQIRVNDPEVEVAYDAPTIMNRGSFTPIVVTAARTSNDLEFTINPDDEWNNTPGSFMYISTSRAISPGVSYFKGPYQLATEPVYANPAALPDQVVSMVFSNLPIGQNVFVRVRVSFGDGRLSDIQYIGPIPIIAAT